uniref:Alpha-catulin n=1 Tax=Sinocyclocheilus grahami TaxID=75366 RepID=A0A672SDL1_SINGR
MASSPCGGGNFDCGLEIQTRSVEQTLIPLVSQITTLINHKDKLKKTEKTLRAIQRVGQAVSVAVGRFVAVGEAISAENEDLKDEMGLACFEARRAVVNKTLLECFLRENIISVLVTLEQLERVSTFQEFVQIFSQFGNEMVEFAHLTGDRQNDLKDEKKRARMAAARAVLEKCTMMLLTASKTCLRHPDCESARINKEAVFQRMRLALEQVIEIVTDTRNGGEAKALPVSIYAGIRDFKVKVEGLRDSLYCVSCEAVAAQLEALVEKTEDFTDSAYTSHEQRETIIQLCQITRQETKQLISTWRHVQSLKAKEATDEVELSILKTCQSVSDLRRELHRVAVGRATELLKLHSDHLVLQALKASGGDGNLEAVADYAGTLTEHKEHLVETCRLLCHISGTEPLEITCIHAEETFRVIGPQIISAAQTLALHPTSKIAKENLAVFCEAWESQLCDMAILLKEINDVFEGRRGDKKTYLSLPRPGKLSANLKTVKAAKLDAEEQTTIAKLGLELCLLTSDVDSEVERWDEQDHEMVRLCQIISSMAYSMYLFTSKALHYGFIFQVLSDQGLQLCHILHSLSTQLLDEDRILNLSETEKLSAACQQLQVCAKTPVQGKSAIFQKVDSSIQNTKGILTVVVYLLPICNKLIRKCKSERSCLASPQHWREKQLSTTVSEETLNGKGSSGFGVKSLEQHMANLTFLESK